MLGYNSHPMPVQFTIDMIRYILNKCKYNKLNPNKPNPVWKVAVLDYTTSFKSVLPKICFIWFQNYHYGTPLIH